MVVKRTPWSSTTTVKNLKQPTVIKPAGTVVPKAEQVNPEDPFEKFRGNKASLDKAVQNTIDRIMTDKSLLAQPKAEKEQMVQQVLDIAYRGATKPDKPSGLFGVVKGIAGRVLAGPALAGLSGYEKVAGPVRRTIQSAVVETLDSVITAANMVNPVESTRFKGDFTPRFSDFGRQIADEDWGIYKDNGSEYRFKQSKLNAVAQFGTDVATDPSTYVGVGATANLGKAGRMALATRVTDNAIVAKYPELASLGLDGLNDLANKIVRYGAAAIPTTVRKGEGIQMGLRYAGTVVPKTEFLEQAFAKSAGRLRAGIGDVVYNPNVASKVGAAGRLITPRSQRRLVAAGAGRRALVGNVRDELALWTATKYMKGSTAVAYQAAVQNVVGFAQRQNELAGRGIKGKLSSVYDAEAMNLYRYIEMSPTELASQPITPELKQLASDVKNWQDSLRVTTNKTIRQFGDDFSTNVRQIGFIDDYIHHQMTREAKEWLNSEAGRRFLNSQNGIRSVDVMSKDITNPQSPLMFRKLRGQFVDDTGKVVTEQFFGRDVVSGTIDEINDIFRTATGRDFNWFETDFAKIADSYAYSMAKAQGRAAYARRLMDFGHDDLIKPLIQKAIPDEELVAQLTEVHGRTMLVREKLRARIASNLVSAKSYAETAKNFAAQFLKGELKTAKVTQQQYDDLVKRLDEAVVKLSAAHATATGKEAAMRGDFGQMHQVLMDEITRLRGAINDPDRFAAAEELKAIYMQIFPNHNPTLLDSKSPEWIAEKILHANGVPATREVKVINKRLRELRNQIDELPDGAQYDEIRQSLESDYYTLENQEQAFSTLGQIRMDANYSDGFMYGFVDDLVPLPEEELYKVFRTSPERFVGEGFREMPEAVAVHAVPSQALIDMRVPADFRRVMSDEGIISGLADELYRRGFLLESEGLREQGALFFRTGAFDPQWEEAYPEMANLIATIKMYGASEGSELLSDVTITSALYDIEEALRAALPVEDYQDIDLFAREAMNTALGRINATSSDRAGILIPQGWWDDLNEAVSDYVVMVDPSFKTPKPDLNPNSEAQFVNGNEFVTNSMDNLFEEQSLQASLAKTGKEEEIIQLENQMVLRSELKGEAKSLAGKKGGLTRAAKARVTKTEQALETLRRTDSIEIMQGGKKITVTREQAQRALVRQEKKLVNAYQALQKEIDAVYVRAGVPREGTTGGGLINKITDIKERLPMLFNQAEVLRTWSETTGVTLAKDIQDMRQLLVSAPPKGAAGGESAAWVRKVDRTLQAIGGFQDPATAKAYERVTTLLHADEAQLAMLEAVSIPMIEQDLYLATAGALGPKIIDTVEQGWSEIYGLGVQIPDELLDVWRPNLNRLNDKTVAGQLKKAYFEAMNFFKVYATSTVGFFVRNAMSATFMNYVAGVSTDNILLGFRAARAIQNGTWEDFLKKQTPELASQLEAAYRATQATGRGVSDMLSGVAIRGKGTERIINNRYTRFFQRRNEGVELGVRLPMALDSIKRGQTMDQAIARVTRYHFDYSDLSELDEMAKALVPFWIWTSRNVPLQIVEQWTNPRAYTIYEEIKQTSPVDDKIIMPKWIADWEPMALGGVNRENGQWVLTPDVPVNQLDKQLQNLVNPKRLVGQMAPVVKVPIELIAGKQLGIDVGPFKDKLQPAQGLDAVIARLASIAGGENLAKQDPVTGEWLINERVPYIVQNALPFLGQLNRVTGGATGGKPSYGERQLGNIANWFGVPTRYVGPQQQASEAVGRSIEIGDLISQWIEQGKLIKKK
jgi:hypothetical protein